MVSTSLHTEHYTTKCNNESDYEEDGYRASISRKICFHERSEYPNFWTFEMGTQESINIPIWIYVVFQQNGRQHDQNLNNDTFVRLPVISGQVVIGTERYLDSGILLNYNDDDYSPGYDQTKEAFRALTKDNILQPYISEDDFRSSNEENNIGYDTHACDKRYRKNFRNAQPVKVEFKLSKNIRAGIYGYSLVLTNRLASISSDGQRLFDLT